MLWRGEGSGTEIFARPILAFSLLDTSPHPGVDTADSTPQRCPMEHVEWVLSHYDPMEGWLMQQ